MENPLTSYTTKQLKTSEQSDMDPTIILNWFNQNIKKGNKFICFCLDVGGTRSIVEKTIRGILQNILHPYNLEAITTLIQLRKRHRKCP